MARRPHFEFRIDDDGLDALCKSQAVGELVAAAAVEVAATAPQYVPQGRGDVRGSYRATGAEETQSGLVARAESDHPAATFVEFGTANNPAYAPLRRAAEALGLEVRLTPKGTVTP